MEYPPLEEVVKDVWPSDVIARARELREDIGSVGAYSHSKGVPLIRKSVAQFIEGNLPPTSLPPCSSFFYLSFVLTLSYVMSIVLSSNTTH